MPDITYPSAVPKCKECTSAIILLLWQLVGYATIANCSKKTIRGYYVLYLLPDFCQPKHNITASIIAEKEKWDRIVLTNPLPQLES